MTAELLDAIAESPNDDGPRLVYADWLQQQPSEALRARGEYIALACTTVRPKPTVRIQELLDKYGASWLGPVEAMTTHRIWSRGFLESCHLLSYPAVVDLAPAFGHPAWCVLRALYTEATTPIPTFEQLAELICRIPSLRCLRTSVAVLRLLAESAHAPRFSELQYHPWGGDEVGQLISVLDAPCFERLRRLHLLRCPRALLQRLLRPGLAVIALAAPPRAVVDWLPELIALQAPLEEFRLVRDFDDVFDQRGHELVLHGHAGTWHHLEVRWSYEDDRGWRDEVLQTLSQLGYGTLQRLSFVGPPSARFDVARFKQRVAAAVPGAVVG